MAYKTLMVQVDVEGSSVNRIHLAAQLADQFQAKLIGVCASAPPEFVADGVIIDPYLPNIKKYDLVAALRKQREAFNSLVSNGGRQVEWRSDQALPSEYLARQARAADLVIVTRERATADPYQFPDPGALVLRLGRPMLAVPPELDTFKPRRVIVAWKDTREARRAVQDALPFLKQASEVIVAEVCEHSDEVASSQQRLRDVAQYLACHEVKAVAERVWPLAGSAENTLIQMAQDVSADLIVAGAYGHSRLGEWIFSGVTQGLLARSPVCCLLSH